MSNIRPELQNLKPGTFIIDTEDETVYYVEYCNYNGTKTLCAVDDRSMRPISELWLPDIEILHSFAPYDLLDCRFLSNCSAIISAPGLMDIYVVTDKPVETVVDLYSWLDDNYPFYYEKMTDHDDCVTYYDAVVLSRKEYRDLIYGRGINE